MLKIWVKFVCDTNPKIINLVCLYIDLLIGTFALSFEDENKKNR